MAQREEVYLLSRVTVFAIFDLLFAEVSCDFDLCFLPLISIFFVQKQISFVPLTSIFFVQKQISKSHKTLLVLLFNIPSTYSLYTHICFIDVDLAGAVDSHQLLYLSVGQASRQHES